MKVNITILAPLALGLSFDDSIRGRLSHALSVRGVRWERAIPILAAIFLAIAALAQTQPPDKPRLAGNNDLFLNAQDIEKKIWANAKPYLDYALPELEAAVPELKGLSPANGQEDLTSLLDRVGEKCVDLLQRTPNVISHEEVITQQRIAIVISHGDVRPGTTHAKPQRQRFEYLLLSHQTPSGRVLEEHRTDKHGRSTTAESVFAQGFASDWVRFYPGNRCTAGFRALAASLAARCVMALLATPSAQAQTYKVLYSFSGKPDGALPYAGLIQDAQGNFYGTTYAGGAFDRGTVFKLSKTGKETVLYAFVGGADGWGPPPA